MALLSNLVAETLKKLEGYNLEEAVVNDEQKGLFADAIKHKLTNANIHFYGSLFLIETSPKHYAFMPLQYIALAKICFPLACELKATFDFIYSEIEKKDAKDVIQLQNKENPNNSCSDFLNLMEIILVETIYSLMVIPLVETIYSLMEMELLHLKHID